MLDKAIELLEVIVSKRDKKYSEIEHLPFNCDLAQEALAELNTFIESNGWQDIKTLKESDNYVNFYVDGEVEQGYKEGSNCYIINNGDYNYGGYGSDYKCEDGGRNSLPTHWQPLPSIKSIKE